MIQTDYDKNEHMGSFKLNREIAYVGKIGTERKAFCIQYIKHKKNKLDEITTAHKNTVAEKCERITCQKGCSYCCFQHVGATIQECEVIVYYLYKEQSALFKFLRKYSKWIKRLKAITEASKDIEETQYLKITSQSSEKLRQIYIKEEEKYGPRIPCPFLDAQICSIYEVRPYACAALVATTPPDWCNPLNTNEPDYYRYAKPNLFNDLSFYHGSLTRPISSLMPIMVYTILKEGYSFLSKITGIDILEDELNG